MDTIINAFFNIDIMRQAAPLLLKGASVTLQLCAVVVVLGISGGLALGLLASSKNAAVRLPAFVFIDVFRAIPPLILLILIYAGLPFIGIRVTPFVAVCIAFLLNNSAYFAEIFRSGIKSVARGQTEAARATGLSPAQTQAYVILPQAVRNVLPDLLSNVVEIVKLTSIASVVSLTELLYSANMARAVTYNSSPLVMAALMYLVVLWPLVRVISRFQRGLSISS
ncbi:amino acid ABC transporter permease [Salipiger sp. 1_MG-2023]|uniref:amino acid ABC transporter permease n=1 Tax=Salipiger sp. 1_MG-2023 TaxID=3062665 RepID=UPI0026E3D23C|nr:amino acid ABC transporter permease [Salipiger sp. 1_MG-2023]MDO6586965.1 amino acid ABC transporter permease [Salipiger sp. 1_MG-2023]